MNNIHIELFQIIRDAATTLNKRIAETDLCDDKDISSEVGRQIIIELFLAAFAHHIFNNGSNAEDDIIDFLEMIKERHYVSAEHRMHQKYAKFFSKALLRISCEKLNCGDTEMFLTSVSHDILYTVLGIKPEDFSDKTSIGAMIMFLSITIEKELSELQSKIVHLATTYRDITE